MAKPLTDSILALTRYANEVTGASDQTLSDAVRTLCDGYGQGGGGSVSQDADGYIVLPVDGSATVAKLELLNEITLTEAVHSVMVDASEFLDDYSEFFWYANATLSANDYTYVRYYDRQNRGKNPQWITQRTVLDMSIGNAYNIGSGQMVNCLGGGIWQTDVSMQFAKFEAWLYVGANNFLEGSKFKLYGVKYENI